MGMQRYSIMPSFPMDLALAIIFAEMSTPSTEAAPCSACIPAVPAESASQVQNVLVMEIRQQPFQCFPFSGPFQPLYGTVHLTVFLKKDVIVVLVLFHDGEEMNVAWK